MEKPSPTTNSSLTYLYEYYKVGSQLREMRPPYPGVDFAIKDMGTHLALVVKEEQVMKFNAEQQVSIMEWLQRMRTKIESYGIKCELMGRKYRGN